MDRFGEGPYVAPTEWKPWSRRKVISVVLLTLTLFALVATPMWKKVSGDWAIGNYYRRCVMHYADACGDWPPPEGYGPPRYGPYRVPTELDP